MKIINAALVWLVVCIAHTSFAQININGSFETLNHLGIPEGWDLTYSKRNTYDIVLDSVIKADGKYSVSIAAANRPVAGNAIIFSSKKNFNGKVLSLVGSIKTENVAEGWAGLWIRVDGTATELAYDMMESQGLKGTNDWKEYLIQVPYDQVNAKSINFGAMLFGKGKIWVDKLKLYLDEKPIESVQPIAADNVPDTLYENSSRVDTIIVNPHVLKYLTLTGKIWSFLKYHHPAVTSGQYDWDAALFKHLPQIVRLADDAAFSDFMLRWIDSLGKTDQSLLTRPKAVKKSRVHLLPDDAGILTDNSLSKTLRDQLSNIFVAQRTKQSHYISMVPGVGNPVFENEKLYALKAYPDAGIRLLALYRYWATIQYFSPNRKLTAVVWDSVLERYIPEILKAASQKEYADVLARLVCSIKDGHGFLSSAVYQNSLGKYSAPVRAKYVENKLVVTGYLSGEEERKKQINVGDVIEEINGKPVPDMIKTYAPYIPASNFAATMRDMPATYLLRSDTVEMVLGISVNGAIVKKTVTGLENSDIKYSLFDAKPNDKAFRLIRPGVGYIQGNKFTKTDMDSMKKLFSDTRGMIIDMRGYPIDDLIATIGTYIRDTSAPRFRFTQGSVEHPGLFTFTLPYGGAKPATGHYKGKVVVLVNETTQSNAEFVTMAFQTASRTRVVGSTTAGADGNISKIMLPGGFSTWISGIGVYYPDGTDTQQRGVKIDYWIEPSIKGIASRIDEVLEKGIDIIEGK